ncbi:aspartate/glutamate racemase family protein [Nisaea acidiphila]|uniref:Aspartate/glutamate racemase family protein n=1 Tax=Nisaea acidiphila TaxID=1862145 RepID=A0A9J7AVF5_9PROT|nr:aspartate/glutamate racemase family protein [Nisaea acidiphila]UUX50276.1 aspartate/glutamate racemase family protein [Nisaea acidiphila]
MSDPIVVINPNSTEAVTEAMSDALEGLRLPGGPDIECLTNPDGPPGVESQADADLAAVQVREIVARRANSASAFVIACYSDPGIHAAREAAGKPVFGIAESGMLRAMSVAGNFGVIAILEKSIPRHMRYIRTLGFESRLAGERALGLGVVELSDETRAYARLVEKGNELRELDGAQVVVLGCAGMARYRAALEEEIGIPVIDPTQAAVSNALTNALLKSP